MCVSLCIYIPTCQLTLPSINTHKRKNTQFSYCNIYPHITCGCVVNFDVWHECTWKSRILFDDVCVLQCVTVCCSACTSSVTYTLMTRLHLISVEWRVVTLYVYKCNVHLRRVTHQTHHKSRMHSTMAWSLKCTFYLYTLLHVTRLISSVGAS